METSITTNKGQIVVPKKLRNKYGIKKGTKVAFIDKNGELVLRVMDKEYFKNFVGITKGPGSVIDELMKEKEIEKEL